MLKFHMILSEKLTQFPYFTHLREKMPRFYITFARKTVSRIFFFFGGGDPLPRGKYPPLLRLRLGLGLQLNPALAQKLFAFRFTPVACRPTPPMGRPIDAVT